MKYELITTLVFSIGHCWKWRRWQVINDPALLQRHFHEGLQENDWSGLPRATDRDRRRGCAHHAVGHRRPGGVRLHHKGVLPRRPGFRPGLFDDGSSILRRDQGLEAQGGERVQRDTHSDCAEQDRSYRTGGGYGRRGGDAGQAPQLPAHPHLRQGGH